MTVNVTEKKITVQRREHPADVRYPGRTCQEILQAGMKLLGRLSSEEVEQLVQQYLVLDEEETAELFDSIQSGDVLGLGLAAEDGFTSKKFEVLEVHTGEDFLSVKNLHTKKDEELSFQQISVGYALGFAEILYRGDKPFGVSTEEVWTIHIHEKVEDGEEEKENSPTSPVSEEE
jgi:hypothetical protein